MKEEKRMTNRETKALLKSIEIITEKSKTKEEVKEAIQEIAKQPTVKTKVLVNFVPSIETRILTI